MEVDEEYTKLSLYIDDDARSLAPTVSPEPTWSDTSSEISFDLETSIEDESLARLRRILSGNLSYKEALVVKGGKDYESEDYDSDGVSVGMPKLNSRKIRKKLCKNGVKCFSPYCSHAHCLEHLILDECKKLNCDRRRCLNFHPGDNIHVYLRKRRKESERKKVEKLNNQMDELFLQYAEPREVPYLKKKLQNIQNLKKEIDTHLSEFDS